MGMVAIDCIRANKMIRVRSTGLNLVLVQSVNHQAAKVTESPATFPRLLVITGKHSRPASIDAVLSDSVE